ncbi:MAG: RluA family pseudouridine synthase [Myxococcota bacterium]
MSVTPVLLWGDDRLAVYNKPHGVVVYSTSGGAGVLDAIRDARGGGTVHAAHRLDAPVAGALMVAFDAEAAAATSRMFASGEVEKTYLAACQGVPAWERRTVDAPLAQRGHRAHVVPPGAADGKPAETELSVRGTSSDACLVQAHPRTGRFHQVRAHLSHVGHPILGDREYGGPRAACLALHCAALRFRHPFTGASLTVRAPLQPQMERVLLRARLTLPPTENAAS